MRSLILGLAVILAGCGGGGGTAATGGGDTGACSSNCSPMYLSMTDADGDFLNYTVDVVSLTLKKASGAVVQTLPVTSRVNFTDLVDMTEFVTAATIPNGDYVEGSIRLDYRNAEIFVDVGGQAQPVKVVDSNGQAVGQIDLAIKLDNRNHLIVAPGRPALLKLDFDLAASNSVDLTQSPVLVTLRPFIVADVDVADSKEMRIRGPLVSVDSAAGTYTVDVRPFQLRDAKLGEIQVHTTTDTAFEIDGQTYTGAAGLDALAHVSPGAPTAAFGTLTVADKVFTAARVHAGSSVEGAQFDAIWGNVVARSGNALKVRGVTFIRKDGSVKYVRSDATLTVGMDTKIIKDGVKDAALTADALSVGQRIRAFGNASEDANGNVTLDATAGRVRMHLTNLLATVIDANPGNLTLNLASIGPHRATAYDFTGTGMSPAQDADPSHYEVTTGALDLTRLAPGSPTRVIGFVTPFGSAPADFDGRTVVDYQDVASILAMGWGKTGAMAPFLSIDATGIVIDNHNGSIGARHFIATGPILVDVKTLAAPPRIIPRPAGRGMFAIGEPGTVEVFSNFGDFTAKLAEKLGAGQKALGLTAAGQFDAAASTLTTARVTVTLSAL
jgi:hypothetical protein